MVTSARYEYVQGNFAWPVPFPFGSETDVGVRLEGADGLARQLTLNADYIIQGGNVIYVLPRGQALIVYLNGPLNQALAANAAHVLTACTAGAAQPLVAAAIAAPAAASADNTASASLRGQTAPPVADARYDELAAKVQALTDAQAEARQTALTQAEQERLAELEATGAAAGKTLDQKTDVALDAITLATEEAEARLDQQAARALAVSAMADTAAAKAEAAGAAASEAATATLARLEQRIAELETRLDAKAGGVTKLADNAASRATALIVQAQTEAQAELAAQARLAGQAWPELGWQNMTADLPATSIIRLPGSMRYYPGRNSLLVARNGFMLAQGHDFEEVGTGAEPSSQVRIIAPVNEGDLLAFWVFPTNVAQAAKEAQAAAERAAHEAAGFSAQGSQQLAAVNTAASKSVTANAEHLGQISQASGQAQANIRADRDAALQRIRDVSGNAHKDCVSVWQTSSAELRKLASDGNASLRQTWSQAAKDICEVRKDAQAKAEAASLAANLAATRSARSIAAIHFLADCAWQAAWQASMDNCRPGIASVRTLAELATRPSGVYFLNPNLACPSHFMGLWPVRNFSDINFDGVFFLGQPYPDQPELPDPPPWPDVPADIPEMRPQADVNHWLPCGHSHN